MAFWSRVLPEGQRRTWTPSEKEAYAIVMAPKKWAGYIALHPVTVRTGHQSLQWCHKEHVDTPSGPASRRARWHETLAKFYVTVVYVPRKDNTVADCLSRWAYPARKGMTEVSAHGDDAEIVEAEKIIDMERMTEEDGVKCFVIMAAEAPYGRRVSRAVRVYSPQRMLSPTSTSSPGRTSKKTGPMTMPSLRPLSPCIGLSPTLTTGRSGGSGSGRKIACST